MMEAPKDMGGLRLGNIKFKTLASLQSSDGDTLMRLIHYGRKWLNPQMK